MQAASDCKLGRMQSGTLCVRYQSGRMPAEARVCAGWR